VEWEGLTASVSSVQKHHMCELFSEYMSLL
jgi:hypothetical protein